MDPGSGGCKRVYFELEKIKLMKRFLLIIMLVCLGFTTSFAQYVHNGGTSTNTGTLLIRVMMNGHYIGGANPDDWTFFLYFTHSTYPFDVSIGNVDKDGGSTPELLGTALDAQDEDLYLGVNFSDWGGPMAADPSIYSMDVTITNPTLGISKTEHFAAGTWDFSGNTIEDYYIVDIECPECEPPSSGPTIDVMDLAGVCWPTTVDLAKAVTSKSPADAVVKFYSDEALTTEVATPGSVGLASNPTTQQITTYYAQAQSADGSEKSEKKAFKITINPQPEIKLDVPADPVCYNAPVTLTVNKATASSPDLSGITNYRYYNQTTSFDVNSASSTYNIANITAGGIFSVDVTGTGGCKATASATITVTNTDVVAAGNIKLTASGSGDFAVCSGDAITLTASLISGDATGVTFEWGDPIPVADRNAAAVTVSPTTNTTYSVKGKVNGCLAAASKTQEVKVNIKPTLTITNPAPVCGGTVNLTQAGITAGSTSGLTYTYWTDVNCSAAVANSAAVGAGTYYIKGTNASTTCWTAKPVTATVNTVPTAVIAVTGNVTSGCSETTVTLTAQPTGMKYSWSNGATTGSITPTLAAGNNSFTLTVTDNNNCSNTTATPVVITGNAAPIVKIDPVAATCAGSDINLNAGVTLASGAVEQTASWTGSAVADASQKATTATLAGGTNKYTFSVTDDKGCTGKDEISVTGNELAVDLIGNNSPSGIPSGSSVVLTANAKWNGVTTLGITYTFEELSPDPKTLTADAGTPHRTTVTPTSTATYKVTVSKDGCTKESAIYTVKVLADPFIVDEIAGTLAVCENVTDFSGFTPLSVTAKGGQKNYTYAWSVPAGMTVDATNAATMTITGIDYTQLTPGTHQVSVTVSDASEPQQTVTKTKWFKVNGLPTIKINNMASGTIQACKEVASSLTASIAGTAGGSFTWATPVADADKNKATIALNTTVEGSVSYTVMGVDGNGCVGTATVDVNVNPLPELTLAAKVGDNVVSSVCPNTTITLDASATGITDAAKYAWSGGATGLSGLTPTTVPTKTAGTTYIVTVTDEKGCSAKKEVTVAVYTPGTISVNADYDLVCAGSSVTLTASGGSDYAWTGQGLLTTTGATQIVTLNTANTYTYTVTGKDGNGCVANPGTKNITVSTAPTLVLAKTSVEACVGTSIDLASAIDKGLSTNGATVIVKTAADVPVIGTSVTTAGSYKISLKLGSCETETKLVAAVFNPLPDVTLAVVDNKTSVCSGSQITLNATSTDATAPSFKWEDATTGASKTFTTANAGTTNINVTYKVTADNGKCKKDATAQVTVKALPDVKIANPGQVCTDNAVLLSASGADTYVWNNDASKTGATCNIMPTMSNNVFTVIGHNNTSGCEKQATVTLDVTLAPTMVVNALAPICEGTQVNLASAVIGVYQLEFFDAGKNKLTNGQVSTAGTYYIQGHLVETCKTEMYPVTVTVNPKPAIVITGTTVTCAGGSVTLTASGGSTYAWNTGAKTSAITVTPSSTTTYDVTGTASNGCSAKVTQEVTVHPKPVLAWNTANPTTVVENRPIIMIANLTETTTGPYVYTWTKPADAASNITSSHTLAQAKTNPEKFEVKVTDGNNCVSELLAANVEVTPAGGMLKVELSTVTNMLCVDGSQILIAKATGGTPDYSYAWSKDGVAIPGEVGESLTVQDGGTYRVTVSDNGASVQTQFKEKILSASALHAPVVAVADQTIPSGTSTVLFATVTGGDNNNAFTWTPLEKLQSGVTTANPVTTVLTADQLYQVYVQDGQGCLSTPKTLNVSVDNVNGFTVVASANPATVCIGAKSKLDASLLGSSLPDVADLEYVWTSSVKSDLALLSSPTVKSPVFTADAASTKNYFVKVTDVKSGRVAGGQVTVTVSGNKKPQLSLPGAGEIACVGDQVTVTVADASVNDFSWMIDKQPVVLGTATYVLSDAGSHLVEVFAKATNGCASDTVRQNYNLSALPTIAWADGNPASVEKNSDVTIKAIADGGKAGNYTYNWTKPTEKDEATGSYTVTKILAKTSFVVAVTDNATGCKSSDITHVVSVSAATPDIEFATNVESGLLCQGGISVLDVISVKGGVGREDIFDDYTYAWYKGSELKASARKYAVTEAGIYKIEVKDKNGKLASKDITVTVDSRVAPTVQGATLTIASGSQAVLYSSVSGGTAPYNYQWEPMDKLVTASTIAGPKTVALSAAQDYRYYVTDANKCTSQYATVSVNVRESIDPALFSVVALADRGTICVGNTTRLRAETSRTLVNPTYEWAPATGLSAANVANPVFTAVASDVAQTYSYTVKVTENGISATSQVSVTVNPVEAPKLALSDDGVCAGETLTVTNSGASISGAGYKWMIDGVLKTDVTSATYPLEAGTHTVKVYASSLSGCVSDTVTNTYTRKARPVLAWDNTDPQHNPSTATEGKDFTMKVVAQPEQNVTYYWKYMFGGNPVMDYNSTFNDNTVVGAEIGAYVYEVYAMLDGCASTPLLTQTVNVIPEGSVLSVTTDKTTFDVCQSGNAVITATGHNGDKTYTYKWYKGTIVTGMPIATGAVAMIQPSVNGEKYVVQVTDGTGTTAVSAPVTLTINANLAPSPNGANLAVDAGRATVLVSDVFGNTAPYKYFWTPTDKIAAGQTGQANPMTVALSASQGYEYYVTDRNNCVSGKALVQVTVKPAGQIPVIAAFASRTDLCLDNTSQLEVKAVSGSLSGAATYKWSPAIYLSATNISNPVFTATVTGAYEYTVKVIDNGNTMTAKVSVTVSGNNAPKIKWDVNNPVSVKNGDAFTMNAVASPVGGGYKYHWTKPEVDDTDIWGSYAISAATKASYDFEVCAEDSKGCRSEIITKNVPVENASTPLVITVENQKICAVPSGKTVNVGLPVTVTSGHANVTYAWTAQGNSLPLTATTTATAQVDIAGAGAGTYTFNVTATETGNSANSVTKPVTLTIFAVPEAQIDSKCLAFHKDTLFLLNVVNPKDYGYIWGVSMYDMVADKWTPGIGDNTAGSSINGKMVNSDIRYTLTVTDKSELACKAYDTAYVYRIPDAPKVDIDTNTNRLNVKLNWDVLVNSDDYTVWSRKWDPYCLTSDDGGVYNAKKTQTGSEWIEPTMDTLEFYYVTANRNICGTTYHSLTSDTVGYYLFDIHKDPAKSKSDNYMAVYFDFAEMSCPTSKEVFERLNLKTTGLTMIFYWEYITQGVVSSSHNGSSGLSVRPFSIKQGSVIQIRPTGNSSFLQYGKLPKHIEFEIQNIYSSNKSNWNWCFAPLHKTDKLELTNLFPSDFKTIGTMARWNVYTQTFITTTNTPANMPVGTVEAKRPLRPLMYIKVQPRLGSAGFIWK